MDRASDPLLTYHSPNARAMIHTERINVENYWTSAHQHRDREFRDSVASRPPTMLTTSDWNRRQLPTNVADVHPTRVNNNNLRIPHDSAIYTGFIDNTGRYEPGVLNSNWNEERWDVTYRGKQSSPVLSDTSHYYTSNYTTSFCGRDPLSNFKPSSSSLTPPPEPKPVKLPALPDASKKNPISQYPTKPDEPFVSTYRSSMIPPSVQSPPFGVRTTSLTRDEAKLTEYRERWTNGTGKAAETEYQRLQSSRGKSPASERRLYPSKV